MRARGLTACDSSSTVLVMAQLQIPIDDAVMAKLKAAAQKAGTSLRAFVAETLKQAVTK